MLLYCFIHISCITIFIGSYTDSPGIEIIRKHVAEYIERRDGIPCDYSNVILCAGASDGIKVSYNLGIKTKYYLHDIMQYSFFFNSFF